MKCQKCGINDVNFRYTSNVNGNVTEAMLCMQCASESGYNLDEMLNFGDMGNMFDFGNMFGNVSVPRQMFGRSASPNIIGIMGMIPISMQDNPAMPVQNNSFNQNYRYGDATTINRNVEIDENMSKRRELKMQMQLAVENEEFERAAELRDMLKDLEAGKAERGATCDSETD